MEKLNIAEILKDCPSGMELDCAMYEDVRFLDIDIENNRYLIRITTPCGIKYLDKYGCYTTSDKAKCVIFPKGKTTWEGFQRSFKDGDIIYNRFQKRICIYHHREDETPCVSHCRYNEYHKTFDILDYDICICKQDYRLATEEEQHKLFDAIESNGYKWNSETKTLEKLVIPKFKVGDIIKETTSEKHKYTIINVTNEVYVVKEENKYTHYINIENEHFYELIPNKFDITTFKPFDKVLVRCSELEIWHISFFEKYNRKYLRCPFVCLNGNKYSQCILYKDNEHLLDTADNCDDYYKTW